jgi:hypothetical protein
MDSVIPLVGVSPNDVIEPLRGDEEGGVANMDIDGNAAHNILELLDEEEDDELFNINVDEIDESDDELVYDDNGVENSYELKLDLKMKGYKPYQSQGRLSEDSKAILFWRDGENNFSDWKINVVTTNEEGGESITTTTTYHVNKVNIARGPNKSDYFVTLLESDSFSENHDGTITVNLPEEVAAQFPDFLDYIYSLHTESMSIINFQNWKSMMWLANYFQVSKLQKDVFDFIEEDMCNLDHVEDYLSEFKDVEEDDQANRILSKATLVCATMIMSIEPASSLLKSIPPRMFLTIMDVLGQRCSKSDNFSSHHINCIVLEYLEHNIEDQSYFSALSDMMGLTFFRNDDAEHNRGEVALDWFELMGRKGWKDDWFTFVSTAFLRRYLSSHEPSTELMERVVEVVPNDIVARLYREALLVKLGRKQKIRYLKFKVTELSHHAPFLEGHVINELRQLPPIESTDSIALLKFSIARKLGHSIITLTRSWKMELSYNGVVDMEDDKTMASYDYFSTDENLILVKLRVR